MANEERDLSQISIQQEAQRIRTLRETIIMRYVMPIVIITFLGIASLGGVGEYKRVSSGDFGKNTLPPEHLYNSSDPSDTSPYQQDAAAGALIAGGLGAAAVGVFIRRSSKNVPVS